MSFENVYTMDGGAVAKSVNLASEHVVSALREALEEAEAGDVMGVALVLVYADETTTHQSVGLLNRSAAGALAMAQADVVDYLRNQEG